MAATGQGEDPTWHLLFFLAVMAALCWLVWFLFHVEILSGMRYLRLGELWVVGLFNNQAKACYNWLRLAPIDGPNSAASLTPEAIYYARQCFGPEMFSKLKAAGQDSLALQYYTLSLPSLGFISSLAFSYLKWPVIVACFGIAYYAMYLSPRNKFKTRHTLESFIKTQAQMWPVISPIVNFIPTKASARIPGSAVPDKLPVFAEALSPEEWISFHRIPVTNGLPDKERTRRAFLLQLGPRWRGIDNLPPHILALFATFALRGAQKREECDDMLGRLAIAWTVERGFQPSAELMNEVKKIARDPALGGQALKVADNYAYRTTAMLAVLKWARFTGGVLAPGQFVWLRGQDRALWYPLNNLGRRSFHVEGAGALAHFMAEEAAHKPLVIPRLDTAIITLNQYMAKGAVTIPPREEPGVFQRS